MAKRQKKLSWADTEEVAFRLIDEYPQLDPRRLSTQEVFNLVTELPEFSDKTKPNAAKLEELATRWYEERSDMDDELGPLREVEAEDLDEDDYRDDRMVDQDSDDDFDDDDEENDTVGLDDLEEDDDDDEEEERY